MLTPRPLSLRLLLTCGARPAKHWVSPACSVLHLALAGHLHSQRVLPHRHRRTVLVALTRQRLCRMEARSSLHGRVAVAVAAAHEGHASRLRTCASATGQAWRGMHCGDQSPVVRNARPGACLPTRGVHSGVGPRPCRCASRWREALGRAPGAGAVAACRLQLSSRGSGRSFVESVKARNPFVYTFGVSARLASAAPRRLPRRATVESVTSPGRIVGAIQLVFLYFHSHHPNITHPGIVNNVFTSSGLSCSSTP